MGHLSHPFSPHFCYLITKGQILTSVHKGSAEGEALCRGGHGARDAYDKYP